MMILQTIAITVGLWRAVLMTPGGELPFHLKIDTLNNQYTFSIINSSEEMLLDAVEFKDDSVIVNFPVYESQLRLKVVNKDELEGNFINLTRLTNAAIPMKAYSGGAPRFFVREKQPPALADGRWSVMFGGGTKDSSYAIGVFKQNGHRVDGTFLTGSGDYRYLEGVVDGDSLFLSAFDGVFVYLFKARVGRSTLEGMFYSGTHYQTHWTGFRDPSATLPDPSAITKLNTGDKKLAIRFPDTDSNMVSLDDTLFNNKVIVLQILGSWCPNCLDESKYLKDYYLKNSHRGMSVIGLAFEKTDDFQRAANNVKRFTQRLGITYPVLVASNRSKIKTVFPGLENFMGYPTTIFLDKQRNIRKIHAGFSGPATGPEYEKFKDEFERFMDKLLSE